MGDHPEDVFEAAFDGDVDRLASVMGHECRVRALKEYCTGLLVAEGRKSVEPLAAVIRPDRVAAKHQSLLHFVGLGGWSDEALLAQVRAMVLPVIERHGPIEAWIIDGERLRTVFLRRASTRWGLPGNTAANAAKTRTARRW